MGERSKYSKNGVYRCGNFAQHLAQNTFPEIQLGTIGGINGWYIKMKVIENGTIVYPVIHCHNKPQLYIHYYFNILGNGQSFFNLVDNVKLYETYGPRGHDIKILDILNQKNNYLDNETLSIEYGIHINGILGNDRIWKFYLNNKLFNPNHSLEIEYWDPNDRRLKTLYCHKQLLRLQSPRFQGQSNKFISRWKEKSLIGDCLQIAHGVRVPLETSNSLKIASIAHHNKLRNVVQYADQQLVAFYWCPKITELKQSEVRLFENCMEFGLRHFLTRLVDPYEGLKDLKDLIQQLDIETMSGEAMKTFAAKIFKLGT